jgi:hypothetical protein
MPSILIVEKLGAIKSLSIKTFAESDLYKKAGFKTAEGFKCHTTWTLEVSNKKYQISLYAKTTGRANQENKYEFPPPVDKVLYFGNCLLVNKNDADEVVDLTKNAWEEIYEKLYGGFEDIGDEDTLSDEDDDEDPDIPRTKAGYLKDGFVVDDDEEDDDYDDEDEEDEDADMEDEEEDDVPKIKSKSTKSKRKQPKRAVKKAFELPAKEEADENIYLDCTSELSEESYIE